MTLNCSQLRCDLHVQKNDTRSTLCAEVNEDVEATAVSVYKFIFRLLCCGMLKQMKGRRRLMRRRKYVAIMAPCRATAATVAQGSV